MIAEYPAWFERPWIDRALKHYRKSEFAECAPRLEKAVQKLSDGFTVNREDFFPDYQSDPELLLAYGLFYFPQTYARARFPLSEIVSLGWVPPSRPVRILDLGCGTGAAGFSTAAFLHEHFGVDIEGWALDQSAAALRVHAELASGTVAQRWTGHRADLRGFRGAAWLPPVDVIVVSFAWNEIAAESESLPEQLLPLLAPSGVILILEPAQKETSERLERCRDRIASRKDVRILAPCPHSQACPLLAAGNFWCHEVRKWRIPQSLELLNRHLFREIDVLKFSFLAISAQTPPGVTPDPARFRLISPFARAKGKWIAAGCAADGNRHEYEILNRDVDSDRKSRLQKLERGETIQASRVQEVGERYRLFEIP